MIMRALVVCVLLTPIHAAKLVAQEVKAPDARHITLQEAVELALKHNHAVRIAAYKVEEKERTKDIARSAYFPILRNDSSLGRLTDTQFIAIPAGTLGIVSGSAIPERTAILNQGARTILTSGTSLTQPISELWKVRPANDVAAAELNATRSKARQTENEVALKVHVLYYQILVLQAHRDAVLARIQATEDLGNERVEQVKYGSSLEEAAIESRAESLESKQDLLTTRLQLSDVTMRLNDAIGLPLITQVVLDAAFQQVDNACEREECLRVALESHPEIAEAQAEVEKASAAVRLAKREYLPDIEVFVRHSYQDNVPFLARNFGTFGVHLGYDLFDGGRRSAAIGEHKAQLGQAEENLARVKEDIELRVETAYNKLERTRQMLKVSQEVLELRTESRRVLAQQLQQGMALRSQVGMATARELEARTLLLQCELDYTEARDEMEVAIGQTPD